MELTGVLMGFGILALMAILVAYEIIKEKQEDEEWEDREN